MKDEPPVAAFVLTLLAGLWMLGTGGMSFGMMGPGITGGSGSWMWGHGMMHPYMTHAGFGPYFPWLGAVGGIVLLVGAVVLYTRPEQSRTWGIVILVVSALSALVGMGGVLAGAVGVIGGVLAMTGA
jgi:hypothetical protein